MCCFGAGSVLMVELGAIDRLTTTHRPYGENIAVGCVSDSAGTVEHSCNAFLWPISASQLTLHEIMDTTSNGRCVLTPSTRKGKKSPRCIHHSTPFVTIRVHPVLGIVFVVARGEVFSPSTIGTLMLEEKIARPLDDNGVAGLSALHQSFDAKPSTIAEATRP
jgi:hypothetical protein